MSKHPLISILMPVKNAETFLSSCLNSILDQSYTQWELVAVDDHSSDSSVDVLQQFARTDSRINVQSSKGQGIIDALRTGLEWAQGTYITRMDADDIMMPNKLECLLFRLMERGRAHVAVGCVVYFAEGGLGDGYRRYADWLNGLTRNESNWSEIYKECVIPSPCWMIHRDDLAHCGAFDSDTYPEDYDLCFRFYEAGYQIAGVDEVIHRWRDYPHRTSRTHEHYADNRFLDLKMKYFLKLDYDPENPLVVWGAGKKGKWIARYLIDRDIEFDWVTNNVKKIGKEIYGVVLKHDRNQAFDKGNTILLAVANQAEKRTILQYLHFLKPDVVVRIFS